MPKKFLVVWFDDCGPELLVGGLPEDVAEACDDGECEIIDITDSDYPLQKTSDGWDYVDITEFT